MKQNVDEKKERKRRAEEWRRFRAENLFTQRRLADIVGISRRTVQQIESGRVTPHPTTLLLFEALKRKDADNRMFAQRPVEVFLD